MPGSQCVTEYYKTLSKNHYRFFNVFLCLFIWHGMCLKRFEINIRKYSHRNVFRLVNRVICAKFLHKIFVHSNAWETDNTFSLNTSKTCRQKTNVFLLEMLFIDLFARKYLDCKGMCFFLFETSVLLHDRRLLIDDNGNKGFCHHIVCLFELKSCHLY